MIEIYTDGSCLKNPGPGGWAGVGNYNGTEVFVTCGGDGPKTTNNIMELTAVIRSLEMAYTNYGFQKAKIYTDSSYVKNGITQWVYRWEQNGWKTSQGSDVKNKKLWKTLVNLVDKFNKVEWQWVKAHNGNPLNEKVDKLARQCATEISSS